MTTQRLTRFSLGLFLLSLVSLSFAQPHQDSVGTIAYSPNGAFIATGGTDNLVKIWDTTSGQNLYTLSGHQGVVSDVEWSPNGEYLSSVSLVGELFVWDTDTWLLNDIDLYKDVRFNPAFFAVDWNPNSTKVVVSGQLTSTFIYDIEEETYENMLLGHLKEVSTVAWSPNGAYIIGGGWDGQLILWEAQSGEISSILREPDLSITGDVIQWHPNGSLIAVGNYGGTVKLWNPFSGHIAHELATGGTTLDVAWSADGAYLAALEDGTIYVWETNSYTLTQTIPLTEYGDIYSIDFDRNRLNLVYYADNASQSPIQTSSLISLPITTPTPPASGRWGK